MEIWKDIEGYEGLYQVSNAGNVQSLIGWDGVKYIKRTKKISLTNTSTGYKKCELIKNKKKKSFKVHRLVAVAFLPKPIDCNFVHHKDGDKFNNKAENLEWVTFSQNIKYDYETGARKSFLPTEKQKEQLQKMYEDGESCVKIAEFFNASINQIRFYIKKNNFCRKTKIKIKYDIDYNELFDMFDKGIRNRDIAKHFNCTTGIIATRKHQYFNGKIGRL